MKIYISTIALIFVFHFSKGSQIDSLQQWISKMPDTSKSLDSIYKVIIKVRATDPEKLEIYARQFLKKAEQKNEQKAIGDAHHALSLSYWSRDLYEPCMQELLSSKAYYEQINNESKIATVEMMMGNVFDQLGQVNRAKQLIVNALEKFIELEDSINTHKGYLNLGVIHFYEEQYDSCIYFFNKVLDFRIANNNLKGTAILHLNLANVYEMKVDYNKAIDHFLKSRSLLDTSQLLLSNVFTGLGINYIQANNSKLGLAYLDSGLTQAKRKNQLTMEQAANSYFKEYYIGINNFEQAYDYLEKEYLLDSAIRGRDIQNQIEILNLKFQDEKKAKQLAIMEKQKAEDDLAFTKLVLISVVVILAIGALLYIQKLRADRANLRSKELEKELEHKNKELTSYALNFIQKNELLNELTEKIAELKKQSDTKSIKELNQMNGIINSSFRMDQDWENFKLMFEELHGDFFVRLKDRFPDLGNAELKLCALLRLNMNLKESSRILGISSDSVKTARYRIRKKFGLATEDNLVDFLIKFDSEGQHLAIA
ncbi:MAG: tetratricopeptide repeat protein [Reichenbachiella sp.]|uniref:tetratricopeptide repeat protein n=1 Tax=Reichenbachiella sp. TaxID=2184521 RepID=UPI00329A5492